VTLLLSAVLPLPAAGCSCPEVDCAGAAVAVDLNRVPDADAARICIDGACEVVTTGSGNWPSGWVDRSFEGAPTVRDDEDFELSITVLEASGSELASLAQTRNFDVDECRCLAFPYRITGSEIERAG
jgi:hypothetical protein